ncbi:MAG: hypothetical protein IID44_20805 [Planctomycetes bacterium]|nr:hypothetical protein [Planctomycetota bacterium]
MSGSRIRQSWVDQLLKDTATVATYRQRLCELGWFMKALKEPLARMANFEPGGGGHHLNNLVAVSGAGG